MTTNSISPIQAAAMSGLATYTYNIPATGRYLLECKAIVPWQVNDAPGALANPPSQQIQDITCVGDTAGSLNNTYFTFYTAGNIVGYYVWYNINGAGTDPAVANLTGIQVAAATGATASAIALATRTAIAAAVSDVIVSGATTHVILTQQRTGTSTVAANSGTSPGFSYAITAAGAYGQSSGLLIQMFNGTTLLYSIGVQSPTQPAVGGSIITQCTAADVITIVLSSLADIDKLPNSVKSNINIFLYK